ncbi:MAG: TIGR03960 family B12-binding radical SAM protein [Coriobacteriia bacterium]|nr:TIGR03960 family B12-binding radical SAM protein [Coriobacteriia bacterium]
MTHSSWERIERLFGHVERPVRYIDSEWGARRPEPQDYRVALLYPDAYEIGMANSALAILYEKLSDCDGVSAERCYVPWIDMADALREAGLALTSLESATPLREFDLVGITLPYELTYTNILEILDLSGIPLRAADRGESDPIVVGGGPCAFNPEPVAVFFDAILIGEGEEAAAEIVAAHRDAKARGVVRAEVLRDLSRVAGVYVPSLYRVADRLGVGAFVSAVAGAPTVIEKRVVADMDAHRPPVCPVVPYMDVVHDRVGVEVLRGCTRGCRFCQAGMIYRPVRERSADTIVRDAMEGLRCTGYDEVSLTSLSTTDHSQLGDILRRMSRRLEGTGVSISLPSLRVDAFSVEMARLIAGGRKTGLTFAPEAGTQRLRDVINKNVTEEDLINTVERAFSGGWRRVKLYFMIGLPTETDDDIAGIGQLVRRVLFTAREATPKDQRGAIRIGVSVSTFVPKAHTPFQWGGQIAYDEIVRKQGVLRESVPRKGGVELSWHDPEVSLLEGAMARGGREIADAIEAAWKSGARFDAWTERFDLRRWREAFSLAGLDPDGIATRGFEPGSPLPWSHISAGVSEAYLRRELARALEEVATPDCSFEGCTGCDVCQDLGVEVRLGGERHGSG